MTECASPISDMCSSQPLVASTYADAIHMLHIVCTAADVALSSIMVQGYGLTRWWGTWIWSGSAFPTPHASRHLCLQTSASRSSLGRGLPLWGPADLVLSLFCSKCMLSIDCVDGHPSVTWAG